MCLLGYADNNWGYAHMLYVSGEGQHNGNLGEWGEDAPPYSHKIFSDQYKSR